MTAESGFSTGCGAGIGFALASILIPLVLIVFLAIICGGFLDTQSAVNRPAATVPARK